VLVPEKRKNFSMVNSELRLEGLITLIQRDYGNQGAISRQVFGIKAKREHGEGAYISM